METCHHVSIALTIIAELFEEMNHFEEIEDGEPVLRTSSLIDLVLAEHLRLEEPVGSNATSCLHPQVSSLTQSTS